LLIHVPFNCHCETIPAKSGGEAISVIKPKYQDCHGRCAPSQ
jgi:hypothetical protein